MKKKPTPKYYVNSFMSVKSRKMSRSSAERLKKAVKAKYPHARVSIKKHR